MLCFWNYCCLSSTLDKCRQKNGRAVRISFTLCKSHFLLSSKAFLLLFSKDQWPQKPRVLLPQKHQHPDRVPQEQFSSSAAQEQNRTPPAKTEFLPSEQCPAQAQWPGSSWLSQQQKLRRQHLKKPSPTVKRCLWGHGLILPLSSCPCPTLHTLPFEAWHSHPPVLWSSWRGICAHPSPLKACHEGKEVAQNSLGNNSSFCRNDTPRREGGCELLWEVFFSVCWHVTNQTQTARAAIVHPGQDTLSTAE